MSPGRFGDIFNKYDARAKLNGIGVDIFGMETLNENS